MMHREAERLPAAQQRQVLDFARALAAKKRRARSDEAPWDTGSASFRRRTTRLAIRAPLQGHGKA